MLFDYLKIIGFVFVGLGFFTLVVSALGYKKLSQGDVFFNVVSAAVMLGYGVFLTGYW